ncbi:TRADD-N-associated membrane domain-containing protein [Streptomyces syringium]|uniref:TRADD-N-associated membrane domain-containing protein n=1 Tax=Streptomyces syringium TaxID=76729 RepID=UPI003AAE5188
MGNEPPPESSSSSQSTRLRHWVDVAGVTVALGVTIWLAWGIREVKEGATAEELGAVIAVVSAVVAFAAWARQRQADRAIDAGRERVREAERGVEGALAARSGPAIAAPQEEAEARHDRRDLALARLWSLTHRRLDLYHEIATNQARRSFVSAQVSMVVGFALLVLFVVLALNVSSTTGAIVTGGLGAVSAALAGFISKTFVKSQQSAADHLKAYFDQPLEFSRYLAAERLLADTGLSDARRAEVVAVLVQLIAAGPGTNAALDTNGLAQQLQDLLPGQP